MAPRFVVETGVRHSQGSVLAHDLYVPAEPSGVCVLLLHGFGVDRKSLRGHAARLASNGALVLSPDMSSLIKGGAEAAQRRNIAQAADAAHWLRTERGVAAERLTLVGHSAGGAVLFEAVAALVADGYVPRSIILLDAVPWARTVGPFTEPQRHALCSSKAGSKGRHALCRQMAQAPPPLPPVRAVDAEEFLGRLRHAALGAGGYAAHEAVRADASAALADFTASFGHAGSLAEAVQRLRVKQPALGDVKLADLGGAALSASAPQPMLDAMQRAGLGQEAPVLMLYIALLFLCACYTYPMAPAAPTAATRRGVSLAERASSLRQPQNASNTRRPGSVGRRLRLPLRRGPLLRHELIPGPQ
jgi:thioesterase domain-containing protein